LPLVAIILRDAVPQFADSKNGQGSFNIKNISTTGLPRFCFPSKSAYWYVGQPICADLIDGNEFYAISDINESISSQLYKFVYNPGTGTMSASIICDTRYQYVDTPWKYLQPNLKMSPDGSRLFIGWLNGKIYVSTNRGSSFNTLNAVSELVGYDFGAAAPGQTTPTLWVQGKINGEYGLFESYDWGTTWGVNRLDTTPYGSYNVRGTLENQGCCLAASKNTYQLVVLSTNGHGIKYSSETPPSSGGNGGGGVSSGGIIPVSYNPNLVASENNVPVRII
jgi:hypothetical protein